MKLKPIHLLKNPQKREYYLKNIDRILKREKEKRENCPKCGVNKKTYNAKICQKCYFSTKTISEKHKQQNRLAILGRKDSLETKKKKALSKFGDQNPAKRLEVRLKISNTLKRKYKNGEIKSSFQDEKIKNKLRKINSKRMKDNNSWKYASRPSKQQLELYYLIKEKYPEAELEYAIKTKHSWRFADIAIPSLKLDIEFDGDYWHGLRNGDYDKTRDRHLNEVEWIVIRFNKDTIHLALTEVGNIHAK